jgi:epoxyqueuosine reductase
VLYAIGNSGEPALAETARALLDDPAPEVRGAAVWALSRLLSEADYAALRQAHAAAEADAQVQAEWASA